MADLNPNIIDEVNTEERKRVYADVHWTAGADLVPSPLYQVYRILTNWAGKDDESLYNRFEVKDASGNLLNSTVEFIEPEDDDTLGNVGDNKYGYASGRVTIKITPNATMKSNYPSAIVNIDGKEYDLERLSQNITFDMTVKDHYVDIHWNPIVADSVETIRVVANR